MKILYNWFFNSNFFHLPPLKKILVSTLIILRARSVNACLSFGPGLKVIPPKMHLHPLTDRCSREHRTRLRTRTTHRVPAGGCNFRPASGSRSDPTHTAAIIYNTQTRDQGPARAQTSSPAQVYLYTRPVSPYVV